MNELNSHLINNQTEILPSPSLKRKNNHVAIEEPLKKSCPKIERDRWGDLRKRIRQLFIGCNQTERCAPLRMTYWKEFVPVKIGEMMIHLYPQKKCEKEWMSSEIGQSYAQFIKNKMLKEGIEFSKNNVIYFNQDELKDFNPSFQDGYLLKNGQFFKPKRYIYVYNRAGDFFVFQKFQTKMGRIQHSSASGGFPVKSAGWLTFDETGNLTEISNFSGHYQISKEQVNQTITYFKEKNVRLDLLKIVFSPTGTAEEYSSYSLDEWESMMTN